MSAEVFKVFNFFFNKNWSLLTFLKIIHICKPYCVDAKYEDVVPTTSTVKTTNL